jgi:carboxymethylenebutenolidase
MAQTVPHFVPPDDPSLVCDAVKYKGKAGEVKAYLARPKRDGKFPVVLVIHEIRGLNAHIRDIARRLAQEGFVALVPDFFSRLGGSERYETLEKAKEGVKELSEDHVVEDLTSGIDYLKNCGSADCGKLGVVGFCWGGARSLYFQTRCRELSAGVVFYGENPPALDDVRKISCPVLGLYGGLDERITGKVPELEEALKKHGKRYSIHIYPGAQHAFHNNTLADRYHPEAAKDAWAKTIAFFHGNLS